MTPSGELRLHLVQCVDELLEILGIEHDRRLLSAAGLLGDLEELSVAGFLQVDVERALLGVDRHGMKILREVAALAAAVVRAGVGRCRHRLIAHGLAARQFGHWVEHSSERMEIEPLLRRAHRESISTRSQYRKLPSVYETNVHGANGLKKILPTHPALGGTQAVPSSPMCRPFHPEQHHIAEEPAVEPIISLKNPAATEVTAGVFCDRGVTIHRKRRNVQSIQMYFKEKNS